MDTNRGTFDDDIQDSPKQVQWQDKKPQSPSGSAKGSKNGKGKGKGKGKEGKVLGTGSMELLPEL